MPLRRRRRHARGTASVEMTIILPTFVVVLAFVIFFREAYVTQLASLQTAQRRVWARAMSNDPGVCGTSRVHPFAATKAGALGGEALALGTQAMTAQSLFHDNGEARWRDDRALPAPPPPLRFGTWRRATWESMMPCNEVVPGGDADGALPAAFDALWTKWLAPRRP